MLQSTETEGTLPGMRAGAARVVELSPREYRLAQDPWGKLTLQGAYRWSEGREGGVEWRDIPTVSLP